VERRQAAGSIPKPFDLRGAQVVLFVDGRSQVRLNGEVKGLMEVKTTRPLAAGDAATHADIEKIVNIDLPPDEAEFGTSPCCVGPTAGRSRSD
jgi:hypothetical protein